MSQKHFLMVLLLSTILSFNAYMIGYTSGTKHGKQIVQYQAEELNYGYFMQGEFSWE